MLNKVTTGLLGLVMICRCSAPAKNSTIELPYYSTPEFTPEWIEEKDPEYQEIHQVEAFSLVNQQGDTITHNDLRGKVYVANFFFTVCPSICPKMTKNLHRVQRAFLDDDSVLLVSHTVMPWVDSVATLNEFAERNEIRSGKWHLLTGSKADLYRLGRQSYFADEGFGKQVTDEMDFLHTENVVLVDQKGRIRGVYNGTLKLEMTRLIEDIRKLKEDRA